RRNHVDLLSCCVLLGMPFHACLLSVPAEGTTVAAVNNTEKRRSNDKGKKQEIGAGHAPRIPATLRSIWPLASPKTRQAPHVCRLSHIALRRSRPRPALHRPSPDLPHAQLPVSPRRWPAAPLLQST